MKKPLKNIETEMAFQICLCELCFEICQSILKISDLRKKTGFLPYYYNLNYTKGILLLKNIFSTKKTDLSVFYLIKYSYKKSRIDITKKLISLKMSYSLVTKYNLRSKIAAHLDHNFCHSGFASAYADPASVDKYIELIRVLKEIFCEWRNYADGKPFLQPIKDQSDAVLQFFMSSKF